MSLDISSQGSTVIDLGKMRKGQQGVIVRVGDGETSPRLLERFMEMGFVEGSELAVIHEGPFGGDPIAVRVRGTIVALRRKEAHGIEVRLL